MTIFKKLVAASAAALIVFHTLLAAAAVDAMMWVSGPRGDIAGRAPRDPKATTVLDFAHGPTKPGDLRTALASGRRVHEPITVVVKVDSVSAEIWKATLKRQDKLQVTITFYRPDPAGSGTSQAYYTLTLGDATLEKLEVVAPAAVRDPASKAGATYLRLAFVFRKIGWTHVDSSNPQSDDWGAQS